MSDDLFGLGNAELDAAAPSAAASENTLRAKDVDDLLHGIKKVLECLKKGVEDVEKCGDATKLNVLAADLRAEAGEKVIKELTEKHEAMATKASDTIEDEQSIRFAVELVDVEELQPYKMSSALSELNSKIGIKKRKFEAEKLKAAREQAAKAAKEAADAKAAAKLAEEKAKAEEAAKAKEKEKAKAAPAPAKTAKDTKDTKDAVDLTKTKAVKEVAATAAKPSAEPAAKPAAAAAAAAAVEPKSDHQRPADPPQVWDASLQSSPERGLLNQILEVVSKLRSSEKEVDALKLDMDKLRKENETLRKDAKRAHEADDATAQPAPKKQRK